MAKIYMIRHGKTAAGWGGHANPELNAMGRAQAQRIAEDFAQGAIMPILVSPKMRARQTAAPLCARWQITPLAEPAITEMPAPTDNLDVREDWLREVLACRWSELERGLQEWRASIIQCLLEQSDDVLMFSHYVAINVAVGAVTDDDRCVVFRPDYCSVTCLSVEQGKLSLISRGNEASTQVH